MPNDFSTKATTLSTVIAASGSNVSVGLGLVDKIGRPLSVGEAHGVELGFAELSLSASDGTASHAFELISESGIHYKADASNGGNISQHLFYGNVQIGDSSHTGDTLTVHDGVASLNGGIEVVIAGPSTVFSVSTAGAVYAASTLDVDGVADFNDTTALNLGANAAASDAAVRVLGALVADGSIHSFAGISAAGLGSFDTLQVGGGFDSGNPVADSGLSVDTDGHLSTNGNIIAQGNLTLGVSGGSNSHTIEGNLALTGNLTVSGNVVQEDTIVVTFEDTILELGKDQGGVGVGTSTLDLGLKMHYFNGASSVIAGFIWDGKNTTTGKFNLYSELTDTAGDDDEIDSGTYGDLQIADLTAVDGAFSGNLGVDGNTTLGTDATNTTGDTLTIVAEIQSSLLPAASAHGLGESSRRWASSFIDASTISTDLTFDGATGDNHIVIGHNQASALSITDDHTTPVEAMIFDSTAGAKKITFGYDLDISGSGIDLLTSLTTASVVFIGASGELVENTNFTFVTADNKLQISGDSTSDTASFVIHDTNGVGADVFSADLSGNVFAGGTLRVDGKASFDSTGTALVVASSGSPADADVTIDGSLFVGEAAGFDSAVDMNSTLNVADNIVLDGANPADRKITSTDVGMTIQTIDTASNNPGISITSVGALSMQGDSASLTSNVDDIDLESAGHIRLIPSASEQIMLENLDVQSEAASQDSQGVPVNNQGITANLSIGSDNDPDAGAYNSALIMSLIRGYEKEDSETKAHIVENASSATPTARPTQSAQVEELLGLVNIDVSTALEFDLTQDRGVGHLYSRLSEFPSQYSVVASGIALSDKFTINGNTYTFVDDATAGGNPFGGTAPNFNVNAEHTSPGNPIVDANALDALTQALQSAGEVVEYTNGSNDFVINSAVSPTQGGANPFTFSSITVNQPELYWENLKIAKWTGSAYGFGTDLQAAYNSSSADADIPSILLGNNYDFDIQVDSTAEFKLRSQSSDFDEHAVTFGDEVKGATDGQKGLAFLDANIVAIDNLTMGSPVQVESISKIVLTIDHANLATRDISIKADVNKDGVANTVLCQITEGGAADFVRGGNSNEAAQAIANALNGNANFNREAFADSEGDKVIITSQISSNLNAGGTIFMQFDVTSTAYSSGGVSEASQKVISGAIMASAGSDTKDIIGVASKYHRNGDTLELLVPGQVFEPNLPTLGNGAGQNISIAHGDEIFVGDSSMSDVSSGEVISAAEVSDLPAGSIIYSLGYVISEASQTATGGAAFAAGTSPIKAVYMPRFVALLPA